MRIVPVANERRMDDNEMLEDCNDVVQIEVEESVM